MAAFCGGGGAWISIVRVTVALGAGIRVAVRGKCAQSGHWRWGGQLGARGGVAARWLQSGFGFGCVGVFGCVGWGQA